MRRDETEKRVREEHRRSSFLDEWMERSSGDLSKGEGGGSGSV